MERAVGIRLLQILVFGCRQPWPMLSLAAAVKMWQRQRWLQSFYNRRIAVECEQQIMSLTASTQNQNIPSEDLRYEQCKNKSCVPLIYLLILWWQTKRKNMRTYNTTVVAIGKFTSAVLWSKCAIFREVYHNMKIPARCWAPRAFIPHISTFKRGI